MPCYINQNKIKNIYYNKKPITKVYQNREVIWSQGNNFYTCSWTEIGNLLNKVGEQQNWTIGLKHPLNMKDGTQAEVRIIGLQDTKLLSTHEKKDLSYFIEEEQEKDKPIYQVDYTPYEDKKVPVHMTLELTTCLSKGIINELVDDNSSQTWSTSALRAAMQKGGAIYENLPDDFKNLLLPVIKRTGRTGSDGTIAPETSLDYLFVPALTEYIGQNAAATYNVNAREGRQYQAYGENLAVQKQLITNPGQNIMYYTRSPATFEDSLYDYFWAIGASNNFSIYPSSTELGITFACCI